MSNKKNNTTYKNKLIYQDDYNYIDIDETGLTYYDLYFIGMSDKINSSNIIEVCWDLSFVKNIPNDILNINISHIDKEYCINTLNLPIIKILEINLLNNNFYNHKKIDDFFIIFEEIFFKWLSNSKTIKDLINNILNEDIELIFEKLLNNKLINLKNV